MTKKRVPWNKGLTKKDPRVMRNISGGSRKTQFKKGVQKFKENNPNWKGGRIINPRGYSMIRVPDHPKQNNGYVFEHRLIMEKHLGRYLESNEIIHHVDGNIINNKLENLEVMSQSEHMKLHNNLNKEKQ